MANKTFEGIDMSMTRCATFFKKTTSGKSRSDKIMMGEGCTMYRVSTLESVYGTEAWCKSI